jgi:hypothetical protein
VRPGLLHPQGYEVLVEASPQVLEQLLGLASRLAVLDSEGHEIGLWERKPQG